MHNPIPKSNLFATPTSINNLADQINNIGSAKEQQMAWLGAMMALNLAHDLIEAEMVKEQV